jgi:hypothetical protein
MAKKIGIYKIVSKLEQGLSNSEFKKIKKLIIKKGNINVQEYLNEMIKFGNVEKSKTHYNIANKSAIGVYHVRGSPTHVLSSKNQISLIKDDLIL